ncbi:MAG: hypothetical protein M3O61_03615 [Gemmatimonadota bacterium]|nr:hypothetical protein [Gemmatimonadota bacterium]
MTNLIFDAWQSRANVIAPKYEWPEWGLLLMGYSGKDDPRVSSLAPPDREYTWEQVLTASRQPIDPELQSRMDASQRAFDVGWNVLLKSGRKGVPASEIIPRRTWDQLTLYHQSILERVAENPPRSINVHSTFTPHGDNGQ